MNPKDRNYININEGDTLLIQTERGLLEVEAFFTCDELYVEIHGKMVLVNDIPNKEILIVKKGTQSIEEEPKKEKDLVQWLEEDGLPTLKEILAQLKEINKNTTPRRSHGLGPW